MHFGPERGRMGRCQFADLSNDTSDPRTRSPPPRAQMTTEPFGTTAAGETVTRITLDNGAIRIGVLTLGAIVQDVRLTRADRPLALGSPDLAAYDGGPMAYFGAIVGPVANRIGGGRGRLDRDLLTMERNATGGHSLHSGAAGLHAKVWQIDTLRRDTVALTTTAAPGEGGLPGARQWRLRYRAGPGAALSITIEARSDAPTWMNCAFHGYWALGPAPGIEGHALRLTASSYLQTDAHALPTGRILPVAESPFDFRIARRLTAEDRIDHNFCLAEARRAPERVAWLTGPDGIAMELATTEPGLQVYTLDGFDPGPSRSHHGPGYGPRAGLALEPQGWPDAPNQPGFPPIRLNAGRLWRQDTRFSFRRLDRIDQPAP